MKPTYEADSKILIKFGRENIYIPATEHVSPIVNLNPQEEINSEIEILKSRSLIERTVSTLGVENIYPGLLKKTPGHKKEALTPFDKAVLMVQKKLDIEGVKKSDVIHVRFQHHDPSSYPSSPRVRVRTVDPIRRTIAFLLCH